MSVRLSVCLSVRRISVLSSSHAASRKFRLTHTLLTWTIWRASTNASKWRMGFNSAFKGLKKKGRPFEAVQVFWSYAASFLPKYSPSKCNKIVIFKHHLVSRNPWHAFTKHLHNNQSPVRDSVTSISSYRLWSELQQTPTWRKLSPPGYRHLTTTSSTTEYKPWYAGERGGKGGQKLKCQRCWRGCLVCTICYNVPCIRQRPEYSSVHQRASCLILLNSLCMFRTISHSAHINLAVFDQLDSHVHLLTTLDYLLVPIFSACLLSCSRLNLARVKPLTKISYHTDCWRRNLNFPGLTCSPTLPKSAPRCWYVNSGTYIQCRTSDSRRSVRSPLHPQTFTTVVWLWEDPLPLVRGNSWCRAVDKRNVAVQDDAQPTQHRPGALQSTSALVWRVQQPLDGSACPYALRTLRVGIFVDLAAVYCGRKALLGLHRNCVGCKSLQGCLVWEPMIEFWRKLLFGSEDQIVYACSKTLWGSGGLDPLINLSSRCEWTDSRPGPVSYPPIPI